MTMLKFHLWSGFIKNQMMLLRNYPRLPRVPQPSQHTNGNGKRLMKYSAVGATLLTIAPPILKVMDKYEHERSTGKNIVANVNGGIRFLRSLKTGLMISLDYYFSMMGLTESSPNYKAMMSRIHQRAADNILQGCLLNGGSYIKLGQGLVAMSHIIPKEYIETLKQLQDKCLVRGFDELKELFKQDFGKEPTDIFKTFDPEPIAAASIAQVYKATTKDDKTIAVKVQYIDLRERFSSDVVTVKGLLKAIGIMHPNFNFAWVIDDLETTLKQELDFINEGLNSEKCAKDLQSFKYIHVPKVYWEYTSSRVLVTEFIDGYKISEVDNLKKDGFSLADINLKLFEAFGHQIFQTGFVHADPHTGNVLVRKVGGKSELVLLDHGLYQQVSEKDRIALSHMWKAIVLNDHVNMKKYSNALGVENYVIFAGILTQSPLQSRGFKLNPKLSEDDLRVMTQVARDRFDSIMVCLQDMPRSLLLVIRNLNTIRAISHDHGNPIDRFDVLARIATKNIYSRQNNISTQLLNYPIQIYFEVVLRLQRIGRWFRQRTYEILRHYGVVPDIENIIIKANSLNV